MSNDRELLHIVHIVESIDRIEDYTAAGRDFFLRDRKTYDAVIRNLQTLSESTQHLSPELKQRYPGIEWEKISGFRNILVHDYLGDLNPDLLWQIIAGRLPELKNALKSAIPPQKT